MRTTLLAIALLLAACGGTASPSGKLISEPVLPDDGGLSDAGVSDAGAAADAGPVSDAGTTAQASPSLGGCQMFPAGDEWNRDISGDAVDAHSSSYLAFMGADTLMLHPDFGGTFGQPFLVVPADQAGAPMKFSDTDQSDPGPYPFPQSLPIQNATDHHATVLSQGDCNLYETYQTKADGSGGFNAVSGAVFDLTTGAPRPAGWTSATASGLPILPGMARYDEAAEQGEILHALAFIAGDSAHSYVAPATHSSGSSDASFAPPMGLRVRLKASFDLSSFTGQSLVILKALKKYGMFLTDNAGGQFWSVAGALDSRWNSSDLEQIKTVPASAFEVVKLGPLQPGQ
jgi:hypothetical protein